MTARQKPCPRCGAAIVYAHAPNGGAAPLEPWPDPTGRYRVDVLDRGLLILRDDEPTSARTKRYERHACVPAGKARPRDPAGQPEQLTMPL